jgi:hypothetical protein
VSAAAASMRTRATIRADVGESFLTCDSLIRIDEKTTPLFREMTFSSLVQITPLCVAYRCSCSTAIRPAMAFSAISCKGRLVENHRLIAFDLPGHGQSARCELSMKVDATNSVPCIGLEVSISYFGSKHESNGCKIG